MFVHWLECTERSQEKANACLQSPGVVWYRTPPQFCTTLTRWLTHRSHDVTPRKWFWLSLFYYTVKWVYREPFLQCHNTGSDIDSKGWWKVGKLLGRLRSGCVFRAAVGPKNGVMCFLGKWKDGFFLGFNRKCLNGEMSGCSFPSSQSEACKEKYVPCTWNSFHSVECTVISFFFTYKRKVWEFSYREMQSFSFSP